MAESKTGPPRYLSPTPVGNSTCKGKAGAALELELFLDFQCPFSAKMFNALKGLDKSIYDQVLFKIIQVPQPWHPASCVKHLAARAVMIVCEKEKVEMDFWELSDILFNNVSMRDEDVYEKSFLKLHEEIRDALPEKVPKEAFMELMKPETISGTAGKQLKWFVRYHRVRGVHVTPTVFVNGIEEGKISSSWTAEQWTEYITNFLA